MDDGPEKAVLPSSSGDKYRRINTALVLKATSLTKSSKESTEQYLQRATHLHLQGKRIRKIEGLDLCTNLKVLYLYDNAIEEIENLEFASIVQYLHLQNNQIRAIPQLPMPSLTKLYLDENEITLVSGLEDCTKLEELHVASQRLPPMSYLEFDMGSLEAIARTLQVLEISGNLIQRLRPFVILGNLRKVFASDNDVSDLAEIEAICALPRLAEAVFSSNPCCRDLKYRDYAIGASSDALKMLDGQPILRHQQIAIRGLMVHRRKCGYVHGEEGQM